MTLFVFCLPGHYTLVFINERLKLELIFSYKCRRDRAVEYAQNFHLFLDRLGKPYMISASNFRISYLWLVTGKIRRVLNKTRTVPFIRTCFISDDNSSYKWFASYFCSWLVFMWMLPVATAIQHGAPFQSGGVMLRFAAGAIFWRLVLMKMGESSRRSCYCTSPCITTKNPFLQWWTTCFVLPLSACWLYFSEEKNKA